MSDLPVVFIAGPTASGKTELAMQLADQTDVALINVDAAQVYRGMNIGTAKLDAAAQQHYPHALIDILDPSQRYDAAKFVKDASALIEQAHSAGKLPVLVGGSLFYFSALEKGVSKLPQANDEVRQKIEQEAIDIGWDGMYQRLQSIDSAICQTIRSGDRQRIQRALEIYEITGQPASIMMQRDKPQAYPKPIIKFNLYTPDRKQLHQRIAKRFEGMLQSGLVEEVERLKAREDLHLDLPSMRCVGYRQVWQYLAGVTDYETMQIKATTATRQLAKRQLTWLRHQRGQIWLSSEFSNNVALITPFLPTV